MPSPRNVAGLVAGYFRSLDEGRDYDWRPASAADALGYELFLARWRRWLDTPTVLTVWS